MRSETLPSLRARLHHLVIGSPDPAGLAAFYAAAMRMVTRDSAEGFAASGPGRQLEFVPGPAKSLRLAGFAVAGPEQLENIRRRGAALGVTVLDHADARFEPGALLVTDPDGNRLCFGLPLPAAPTPPALAARLQHVVVASTDAVRLARFYQEALGFELSDDVVDDEGTVRTSFLRCSEEHHSFAVFQAERNWFDHHCYEAGDWNLIRDWGDAFAALKIPVQWGPGRHGPGNNLFLFIHDRDGNWLEISAELEIVAPDRPTGVWKHEQRTLNSWGSAPLRS